MTISPLVSIIIPCYNSENFIAETIQSAMRQTYSHKEIIVVDDGSTDKTLEIARRYENGLVKVYTQLNRGACAARNYGLSLARGQLIQYLDADDLLSETKIELQVHAIRHQQDVIASCAWGKFTDDPAKAVFNPEPVWQDLEPIDWLLTAWNGGGMMQTACWLTPRNLIEQAGPWNESLIRNPNDDGEFFCRVLLQSKQVKFFDDAKVFYRIHSGQRVSEYRDQQAVRSLLDSCISYETHIRKKEDSPRVISALARNYAVFIYKYFNKFPPLAAIAEQKIKALGLSQIPVVGGKYFRMAASILGFKRMLALRFRLKKY